MRYNKTFKNGITVICVCLLILSVLLVCTIISEFQYQALTKNMLTTDAVITDIETDYHTGRYSLGRYEQKMQIDYTVDGKTYSRELSTDTSVAFSAGYRTHFSVGDITEIYYDPQNPNVIATPLSRSTAFGYMIFSSISLLFFWKIFALVIVSRKKFLITKEEYQKEKAANKAKKNIYKNAKGQKIRVQYFNYILFILLCVFIMSVTMLSVNTLLGGSGTKFESPAEVISLFFVFAIVTSPIWILSLLNRRFFGKVICVLNDDGIKYGKKILEWEHIKEIEYDVSYARIIGDGFDIKIEKAPFLMLKKAKKHNKNITTHLSKRNVLMLAIPVIATVILSIAIFLLGKI